MLLMFPNLSCGQNVIPSIANDLPKYAALWFDDQRAARISADTSIYEAFSMRRRVLSGCSCPARTTYSNVWRIHSVPTAILLRVYIPLVQRESSRPRLRS